MKTISPKLVMVLFLGLSALANLAALLNFLLDHTGMNPDVLYPIVEFLTHNLLLLFPLQLLAPIGILVFKAGIKSGDVILFILSAISIPLCYFTSRFVSFLLIRWNAWLVGLGYAIVSISAFNLMNTLANSIIHKAFYG